MSILNKRQTITLSSIAFLLMIPFVAMQYSDQVNWTGSDFLVMGLMLLGTAALIEIVLFKISETRLKVFFIVVVLLSFLLVWAELAVGIFGTPLGGT